MDNPAQTDLAPAPASSEKDHARVLDMLNSVEMQKRLEEARSKRARILAERTAGEDGPTALNLVPAATMAPKDDAGSRPLATAAPAPATLPDETVAKVEPSKPAAAPEDKNLAGTADAVATPVLSPLVEALPTAPVPVENPRRPVPVLRAPPRPVVSGPAGGISGTGPLPAERRSFQFGSVTLGLLVGIFAGIGVMQVVDIAKPEPSASVEGASGTGIRPSITVDAVSPTAGPVDTATAAAGRSVAPRPRPALRGDAAPVDRLAGRPAAAARPPQIRIDDVLRSSRVQPPPVAVAEPEARPTALAQPPLIRIDDLLRSFRAQPPPVAAAAPEARPITPPPAPREAPERAVLPMPDVATPLPVEPPAATPAALGSRLRMVLHSPPDYPEAALADLRATLRAAGLEPAETRTVGLRFRRNEVRYFHQEDAAKAARIAETIGAESRDFSTYRPSPSLGTVEVWLAARR